MSTSSKSAGVLGIVQLVCKTSSDSVLGVFSVCLVLAKPQGFGPRARLTWNLLLQVPRSSLLVRAGGGPASPGLERHLWRRRRSASVTAAFVAPNRLECRWWQLCSAAPRAERL